MDRPWWFRVLGVITVVSVVVVVTAGLMRIHAGGSNEEGIRSFNCGTIAGLLSHPGRLNNWQKLEQVDQTTERPTPLASGCKIAMFPFAMVMVLFSLVGIAAAVTLAIAVSRDSRVTPRRHSSATGAR